MDSPSLKSYTAKEISKLSPASLMWLFLDLNEALQRSRKDYEANKTMNILGIPNERSGAEIVSTYRMALRQSRHVIHELKKRNLPRDLHGVNLWIVKNAPDLPILPVSILKTPEP